MTFSGWPSTISSAKGYECIPNLLMLSLWLAQYTTKLKFGCGFNVLPMWHPLRLAEDFAMADILTDGRVVFGIGRGYHTREVETFGAPMKDADANRELFEEQFEIIMKAFHEASFSHKGKHYTLPPAVPYRGYQLKEITLVPRPLHLPVETLATDRQWQPTRSRFYGEARHQGHDSGHRHRVCRALDAPVSGGACASRTPTPAGGESGTGTLVLYG